MNFINKKDLRSSIRKECWVFFGAGIFAERTLNLIEGKPALMVDNNEKKQNTEMEGVPVASPEALLHFVEENPGCKLLICVQKYTEVYEQLAELQVDQAYEIFITPVAKELSVIDEIRNHDATLLLSNYDTQGGLYLLQLRTAELTRIAEGSIRGFAKVSDIIYYLSYAGLQAISAKTFEPVRQLELEGYEFCGLVYDAQRGQLIVGDTDSDRVLVIDEAKLEIVETFTFSGKCRELGKESYHVNDVLVKGDYLFASVFSVSGWWRSGIYDGGLLEIERKTGKIRPIPIQGAWFPHSIKEHDERFFILDSMNGRLLRDVRDVIFQTDGFLRGLEFNGEFCYVGQSLHRHVSRVKDRISTSADSGLHIFNMDSRLRRFISLPDLTNIYQIMKVDWL